MKIGELDVSKIYLGSAEIEKIYLGTSQVYDGGDTPTPPAPSYDTQYLTIESLEDGNTISFTMGTGMTTAITTAVTSVSVSTDDGVTWTSMENIGADASLSVTLVAGEKAIWKGEAVRYALGNDNTGQGRQTIFSSTGQFKVYGNIMSLISGDTFEDAETFTGVNTFCALFKECTGLTSAENLILPATTLASSCYRSMFKGCTNLTTAPELPATISADGCYNHMFDGCTNLTTAPKLPATTLVNNCYYAMFKGCTNLTTAPELPATTLAKYCYNSMFQSCTSLVTAPELPATTLTDGCYQAMFAGCASLVNAPELPATTLANYCYENMFSGCTNLNSITCLATDISATNCTVNWIRDVAASGTFVKAASMSSWTTGYNGIPDGWTVQNDDGFEDAS